MQTEGVRGWWGPGGRGKPSRYNIGGVNMRIGLKRDYARMRFSRCLNGIGGTPNPARELPPSGGVWKTSKIVFFMM
jgi:hypothetical protein